MCLRMNRTYRSGEFDFLDRRVWRSRSRTNHKGCLATLVRATDSGRLADDPPGVASVAVIINVAVSLELAP